MGDLTKNFSRSEFKCPCGCGFDSIDVSLVVFLQAVRDFYGKPLSINSGCRCEEHNKSVGGVSTSEHLSGKGVDVSCKDSPLRYLLVSSALRAGLTRIGIADTFIHIGNDDSKPQKVIWTY